MASKLIEMRLPREGENCDIVFVRRDDRDFVYEIQAAVCYESWEQWGAYKEILSDNVDTVEAWRRGKFPEFQPPKEEE